MPKWIAIIPMIIVGVIFLHGLVNAINPRLTWKVFESWKATKEPPRRYFLSRRLWGSDSMRKCIVIMG